MTNRKVEEIEVIARYEKGKPTTYSFDGGLTYLTREEINKKRTPERGEE